MHYKVSAACFGNVVAMILQRLVDRPQEEVRNDKLLIDA